MRSHPTKVKEMETTYVSAKYRGPRRLGPGTTLKMIGLPARSHIKRSRQQLQLFATVPNCGAPRLSVLLQLSVSGEG